MATGEYCKEKFFENEKAANRKLGNLENLRNLVNIISSFLIFEFSILTYNQNRKLLFKNLGKKFPRFLRFPRIPSFQPGQYSFKDYEEKH